jgi:predicted RNA-binding Zn-ribbon protein involved in translation (DUF1610 family)
MKILEKYKIEEIKELLDDSNSFRDFLIKINHSSNGTSAYRSIKNQLNSLGLDIPKYDYYHLKFPKNKRKNDEIFIEDSSYPRSSLKRRIINENIIEYKCEKCGNDGIWCGEKITLQLEHKNGIGNDNRISNLCFLCPNCHSQTSTYSGKNLKKKYICECGNEKYKYSKKCNSCNFKDMRKVKNRPNLDSLIDDIDKIGFVQTGKKHGVSDNTIRKWIKKI